MAKTLTKKFWIFVMLAIFVMCFLVVICLCFKQCSDKPDINNKFYLVYADKNTKLSTVQKIAEEVELRGGAGNIYSVGDMKYVVLSAYCSYDECRAVVNNIKQEYHNCGILELDCSVARNKKIDKNAQNYCKKLSELCKFLCYCSIDYDLNRISIGEVGRKMVGYRQTFLLYSDNMQDNNLQFFSSAELVVSYIDSFYHNVFVSAKQNVYIKKLAFWCISELYQVTNLL